LSQRRIQFSVRRLATWLRIGPTVPLTGMDDGDQQSDRGKQVEARRETAQAHFG
jgi:hypothetical protein